VPTEGWKVGIAKSTNMQNYIPLCATARGMNRLTIKTATGDSSMNERQEHLLDIFNRLKKMLKKYERPLKPKFDLEGKYDLWSFKNIEIDGRKRKEVFFASIIIQSNYVGLYYMPIYTDANMKKVFHPDLLKLMTGKSCFHIKELDSKLKKQIEIALKEGYDLYKKRGWI
jgi:hypothetical protein